MSLTLAELCNDLSDVLLPPGAADVRVGRVRDDSRQVQPGDLFVAVRGASADGAEHVSEALSRGASAVVTDTDAVALALASHGGEPVPLLRVGDARVALAELAAASFGYPARNMTLLGITGTVGKTSVLLMLSDVLQAANIAAGTIGSLGIRYPGVEAATLNTTPGALVVHESLGAMAAAGVSVAAMEVTSHALVQGRVHGLRYDVGIFTNLTLLEHLEYHRSFREYAGAKLRFLDHLEADAPLFFAAGDRAVRQAARRHSGPRISCGGGGAWVHVRREAQSLRGTRVVLEVRRPLPRLDGSCLEPCTVPIDLRTLGRPNTANAALAAAAGLSLGASPEVTSAALSRIRPPRRRLEVVRDSAPIIIDDTVGHPDSITAVFELVERIAHRRLRAVFCVRGSRGAEINRRDAEALAIWSRRIRIGALHITSATDTADERNETTPAERNAFLEMLYRHSVPHVHHERLADAIAAALDGAAADDLVLLLGAQGMDAGATIAQRLLHESAGHP